MTTNWINAVNQVVGTTAIADINVYVDCCIFKYESPIDLFYTSTFEILKAGTPDFLTEKPSLASLFLVGLVSATENYFRDILSAIIRICPVAQNKAADQSINLGSVVWHGVGNVERGAFEHLSFADKKIIRNSVANFLDYDIKPNSPTYVVLNEFDKVCELRHGIVHSSSILPGKNAVKLQISGDLGPRTIKIEYAQLQECALICNALVATFNCDLFQELCRRWAVVWPKDNTYDKTKKNERFKEVWKIFFSQIDHDRNNIPTPISIIKCRNAVMKQYQVK